MQKKVENNVFKASVFLRKECERKLKVTHQKMIFDISLQVWGWVSTFNEVRGKYKFL